MPAPHATDKASSPRTPAEPQPPPGASTSAYATSPTDKASSTAPTTSGRPRDPGSRLSGTTRTASSTAASPTGTLIQNTQRQFTWTRLPPITGPSAAPSAPSADQVPSAFARPDAGTAASSSDSDAGTIATAPAAWTTRAAISRSTPGASAHSTDPIVNPASPATNNPLTPPRAAQPPAGPRAARHTSGSPIGPHDSELRLVPGYCLAM